MFKMRTLMEVQVPHKKFIKISKKFKKAMKATTVRPEECKNKKNCLIKGA